MGHTKLISKRTTQLPTSSPVADQPGRKAVVQSDHSDSNSREPYALACVTSFEG